MTNNLKELLCEFRILASSMQVDTALKYRVWKIMQQIDEIMDNYIIVPKLGIDEHMNVQKIKYDKENNIAQETYYMSIRIERTYIIHENMYDGNMYVSGTYTKAFKEYVYSIFELGLIKPNEL